MRRVGFNRATKIMKISNSQVKVSVFAFFGDEPEKRRPRPRALVPLNDPVLSSSATKRAFMLILASR